MTDIRMEPLHEASVWTGDQLQDDHSWEYPLDDTDRAELAAALNGVKETRLEQITAENFPLSGLEGRLCELSHDLGDGRGFALVRGFPVDGHSYEDIERMYWGFCSHLGTGLTQNGDATFIHYVTDGKLRPSQGRRGVGFPKESKLHIDLTDIVSLLCVQQAPDDPPSRVVSSTAIYNEMLKRNPKALPRLYEGFEWDRMDEHAPHETPTSVYKVPLFSEKDGRVSCQYNRNWINNAAERSGKPLTAEENAIFDLLDEIAFQLCLEFPFGKGDIQFCNNYTVLHGRAAHAVVEEETLKRVLMRIWLDMPGEIRPFVDDALIRYGNGRHGQIGWTAAEMLAGQNTAPRPRRDDGALAI
ncbi:MAG: TauD/TfdA family dioxygenase, partial [Pseudomonadota bacterium]|nr:TauD/TfdA family dioxygenase [Pseudomonadota bacterium]